MAGRRPSPSSFIWQSPYSAPLTQSPSESATAGFSREHTHAPAFGYFQTLPDDGMNWDRRPLPEIEQDDFCSYTISESEEEDQPIYQSSDANNASFYGPGMPTFDIQLPPVSPVPRIIELEDDGDLEMFPSGQGPWGHAGRRGESDDSSEDVSMFGVAEGPSRPLNLPIHTAHHHGSSNRWVFFERGLPSRSPPAAQPNRTPPSTSTPSAPSTTPTQAHDTVPPPHPLPLSLSLSLSSSPSPPSTTTSTTTTTTTTDPWFPTPTHRDIHTICLAASRRFLSAHRTNWALRNHHHHHRHRHHPYARPNPVARPTASLLANTSAIASFLWRRAVRARAAVLGAEKDAVRGMGRLLGWAEGVVFVGAGGEEEGEHGWEGGGVEAGEALRRVGATARAYCFELGDGRAVMAVDEVVRMAWV